VNSDLVFALQLADRADAIALEHFRSTRLAVETKPDLTPVTAADRAVEGALRAAIESERPGDEVLGEEYGLRPGRGSGRRWIVDPIDGTRNYLRGTPVFATLIALEQDGEIVAGVASAPALGRRWWAARGEGSFADGEPIRVSRVRSLKEATISYTSAAAARRPGLSEQISSLARRCSASRRLEDFWQHVLVAEGRIDAAIDPVVSVWDLAALKVIVEEAGGRLTDLAGDVCLDGGSALSSNGILHQDVLAALARDRWV
jgi:histidinol-phosphatase